MVHCLVHNNKEKSLYLLGMNAVSFPPNIFNLYPFESVDTEHVDMEGWLL